MKFDFCRHELVVQVEVGERRTVKLEPKTTALEYRPVEGARPG